MLVDRGEQDQTAGGGGVVWGVLWAEAGERVQVSGDIETYAEYL